MANLVSDILNYVMFVIVNISIDRFKCDQENARSKVNNKSNKKKHADIKETLNSSILMVMVNSALNFFLKLPLVYIPLQNMIATFFYKTKAFHNGKLEDYSQNNLSFHKYMIEMNQMSLITLIVDWLFNFLISIQLFVYLKFNRKLKEAFDTTFHKHSAKNSLRTAKRLYLLVYLTFCFIQFSFILQFVSSFNVKKEYFYLFLFKI